MEQSMAKAKDKTKTKAKASKVDPNKPGIVKLTWKTKKRKIMQHGF